MASVYAVYASNAHNRVDSAAIGIFSSKMKAVAYIKKYAKKYHNNLDSDDLMCLENINQTQGRNVNFEIIECEINPKTSEI